MPIKDVHAKESAKTTSGQGFGTSTKTPTASKQEPVSPTPEGQEFALGFAKAVEGKLAGQLQQKANFLQGLDQMIDSAVDAIAQVEEDILSGNTLERKLAERRSRYAFECVEDASVSFEFEALTTLEVMAEPKSFPALDEALKRISPADKTRLDQAVLAPVK